MKKVLSVALASAMVLGMGVNAFADISYNTGVSDKEVGLKAVGLTFDGELVIEDKDGVAINDSEEDVEFRPGDVVYMPLYGNNQVVYDNDYDEAYDGLAAVKDLKVTDHDIVNGDTTGLFTDEAGVTHGIHVSGGKWVMYNPTETIKYQGEDRTVSGIKAKVLSDGTTVELYVSLAAVPGHDTVKDDKKDEDEVKYTDSYGLYTGEIGKNWSINFVEKSENFVEKASFYRAKASDKSIGLSKNAWYIKVELKDFFDSVDKDEVYYKVYVSDNTNKDTTNKVYVKGTYANDEVKYVDFEWTNNANTPAVWHVKKGENGTAVFDFEDKAFFTVKMYSEEKMYLDLSTAFQKAVANEYDAEFDDFFKFQGTNANFSRTGELIIESNDPNLFVYEIDSDNNLYPVDAKYVKDYQITHTNDKINGYVFNTKTLGNYVLSVDELEVEEETEAPEENTNNNTSSDKENPNTGANDFVGVAVALAVVSVAGAGALALKK